LRMLCLSFPRHWPPTQVMTSKTHVSIALPLFVELCLPDNSGCAAR
jgi:hypothetical protein